MMSSDTPIEVFSKVKNSMQVSIGEDRQRLMLSEVIKSFKTRPRSSMGRTTNGNVFRKHKALFN